MKANKHKIAIAVLALSLTQAASAIENNIEQETENKNTYWGIGIGSVLGAVIAGPPGAAMGAALGGSIGWGKDSSDALDKSMDELEQHELALEQRTQVLEENRLSLATTEQKLIQLKHSNAQQALRLKELRATKRSRSEDAEFLKNLVGHYAQDIYFQSGQSETPEYARERLTNLVELLKAHPDLRVTLKGFTDATGSAKLNAALAQARVDGIKDALKTQGIDETRITGLAIGEVYRTSNKVLPEADSSTQDNILDSEQNSLQEGMAFETGLADLGSINTSIKNANTTPHVLDRRVSIELSMMDSSDEPAVANLAALETSRAEQ